MERLRRSVLRIVRSALQLAHRFVVRYELPSDPLGVRHMQPLQGFCRAAVEKGAPCRGKIRTEHGCYQWMHKAIGITLRGKHRCGNEGI